jgi:hypothetical protein
MRQRRERLLFKMSELAQNKARTKEKDDDDDNTPFIEPKSHYHMSVSTKNHHDIDAWVCDHSDDPSYQVSILFSLKFSLTNEQNFILRLKDHLLGRILQDSYNGDEQEFTPEQRRAILFADNRIYIHKAIRFNYTTYDLRRDQDTVNPRTHGDIMMLSHEDDEQHPHPYWYARVIGIFHVLVQAINPSTSRLTKPDASGKWHFS